MLQFPAIKLVMKFLNNTFSKQHS